MVRLTVDYIKKVAYKPNSSIKKNEDISNIITHISLPEKSIDSIEDLSSFKSLRVLYLHHNNLKEIENLGKIEKLTHLYLQHNTITKMEHFNSMHNLKKLYLGHNCISVVEGLDTVNMLEELHIENQHLRLGETIYFDPRTVKNLSSCLKVLDISGNNMSSLNDIRDLKNIVKINASNNAFCYLSEICDVISFWPVIKEMDLRGNVVVKEPKYRDKIIASTKQLRILDTKNINDVTRAFIHRFELIKEGRKEKLLNQKQTTFSEEIASLAEHLPPGLRQSISENVKKEAIPRAKSLTLSLMQVPINSPGFLSDDSAMANNGLQPRPSRRVSYAESISRCRQKAERESQGSLPQLGDSIPNSPRSHC